MITIEKTTVPSGEQWSAVIRGTRNPMNSWNKSDSISTGDGIQVGESDLRLMKNLSDEGACCRKYLRMLNVYADITAPLYWWKEFDTYKIGTVANSCSTMHKIHAKEFTIDDFSHEHLFSEKDCAWGDTVSVRILEYIIDRLNHFRSLFLKTKDKRYWWQLIQLLPSSYNQKRTVMVNYETLMQMRRWRRNHKLDEWHVFCDWVESLPYADKLIYEGDRNEESLE